MALHLYYDSKKGLVKAQNYAVGNYIMEHDEKGWDAPHHEQVLEIPGRNVKIMVNTNLGWGVKSFMNAKISMMDKSVLNFLDTSLKHSVLIVYAEPGNWNMLFDGIIELYNTIYNSEKAVNAFFDVMEDTIYSIGNDVEKIVNVTTRLSELSESLSNSIYADSKVIKMRMRRVCKVLIQNIEENCGKVQIEIVGQETIQKSVFMYGRGKIMTDRQQNKIENNFNKIMLYLVEQNEVLNVFARKGQCSFASEK